MRTCSRLRPLEEAPLADAEAASAAMRPPSHFALAQALPRPHRSSRDRAACGARGGREGRRSAPIRGARCIRHDGGRARRRRRRKKRRPPSLREVPHETPRASCAARKASARSCRRAGAAASVHRIRRRFVATEKRWLETDARGSASALVVSRSAVWRGDKRESSQKSRRTESGANGIGK